MANYDFTYTGEEIQAILDTAKKLKDSGYIFLGVATPSTNPGTPTQKVYYEAKQAGTYTNFGGAVLPDGISLLIWDGSWTLETVMCGDGGVFDITAYKSSGGTLAKYADLAAALDGGNNIPVGVRKGGMSVKFVQSSDNKYVQYRLMANAWSTAVTDWQGVDDTTAKGSDNFVKSGGIYSSIEQVEQKPIRQVGFWSNSQNRYVSDSGYTLFIPLVDYSAITIKGRIDVSGEVAFVTDFSDATVTFADGVTGTTAIAANAELTLSVPSDAKYLLVFDTSAQNQDRKPKSIIADDYRNLYNEQLTDLWNNLKEVQEVEKDVKNILQEPIIQTGFWSNSQNKFVKDSGQSYFLPCSMYDSVKLVCQTGTSGKSSEFAFIKSFTEESVTFVSGVTGTTTLSVGDTIILDVPSDAKYLMVFSKDSSDNNRLPLYIIGDGQRNLYENFVKDMVPTKIIPTVVAANGVVYNNGQIAWNSITILLPSGIQATISSRSYTITNYLLLYRPSINDVITLSSFSGVMAGDVVLLYNRNGILACGELLPYIDGNRPTIIAANELEFSDSEHSVSWSGLTLTTSKGRIDNIGSKSYTFGSAPILVYNTETQTVTQKGAFSDVEDDDILLLYYRNGKPVMGLLLGYYMSVFIEDKPLICAATNVMYNNNVLSWDALSVILPTGSIANITSGSYSFGNPILVYRPSSNSVLHLDVFANILRGDILLAYYRAGYGIVGGQLLPYIQSISNTNDIYEDDIKYNIYRRGEHLRRVKWTPLAEVQAGEGTHAAGIEVTGIPYSSVKECMKYVGIDVSLHTFMTTIHDIHSLMYTEGTSDNNSRSAYGITYHGVNCLCYFGNVCSAFVTTALGKLVQDNSWEYKSFFERYKVLESQEPENFIVGDIISQNGHCAVISNIERNIDGTVNTIYVSEQAALHLNNVITTSSYTVKTLKDRLFVQNAKVCRYKGLREHSEYTPSTFVLLDNENLYKAGDFVFIDGVNTRTYYKCSTDNKDSVFTASKWTEIDAFEANHPYSIGDYMSYGDNLYRAPSAITASSFNPSNWVKINNVFEWVSYPYVYNDDIVTFAGDRAAFHTSDLIYINYKKGNYTQMQIFKDGTLKQTLNLSSDSSVYQVNVSSHCSDAGMYKARLTDGTNYSRYTYFEVIDTTFSVIYQNGVADMRFSSSNGKPLEFQITEQSGYPIAHDAFTEKEIASGQIFVNPMALLYVLRNVYWGRYDGETPEMYARVVYSGEYGNVVNEMVEIGNVNAYEGDIIYPDKPNDLGTISGNKNIILAGRTADKSYSFSFVAGASASVSIIPAIGNVVWTENLPTYTQGKTYLFQVVNGIGKCTEV